MSKLGLAYLAVNRSVLEMMAQNSIPVSSLAGPKLFIESSEKPEQTEGFQFSTDLANLVAASEPDDAFLRIDLDGVLDLIDTIGTDVLVEAGLGVIPGHDRFAYGVDPFQISLADFSASIDGFEFGPALTFSVTQQAEPTEIAPQMTDEPVITVNADAFETSFRECDDVTSFDPLPSEDVLIAGLNAQAAPAAKTYTRPWMPRGKYFAWLRAQGTLQPRKSGEKAVAVIKPKPATKDTEARPARSAQQLRAIRRSYSIRGRKASAA